MSRKNEKPKSAPQELCEFCDGTVEPRTIRALFTRRGQTVYVDNVPAHVCNRCGEKYYDAPVYKRLEQIAKQSSRIKNKISFPLAKYDMALS
jgi:YgiT-type zinc finger domain-containing protein